MSSTILVERTAFGASHAQSTSPATPAAANWCVVPRCELRLEKCKEGVKLHCCCEDEISCATLQNLCRSLAGGTCSVRCHWNGVCLCDCKLACGNCKIEFTEDGCCISCCTGDQACCEMLQACCEAIACCQKNGCCTYVCLNDTPICCCIC